MTANVPGILHLTGFQGCGKFPRIYAGDPTYDLSPFNRVTLEDFVPGGETEGVGFFPYYDGTGSATHYALSGAAGSNTVTATPSPGWTVNDPNIVGRPCTVLAPLFGVPGFALIPCAYGTIVSNTASQLTVAGSFVFFPGQTSIPTGVGVKFRIGTGQFDVYHPMPGTVGLGSGVSGEITRTLGGCWMAVANGGGADLGYMRAFASSVFSQAPYFYAAKYLQPTGLNNGWKTGGPTRASFVAELTRITAAAAARGDTIKWVLCIADLVQEDMREAGLSLLSLSANLADFHAWLRTLGNPAIELQVVSPHPDFLGITKPGAAVFTRGVLDTYARVNARTRVLDMGLARLGEKFQHTDVSPNDPAPDSQYYETLDYVEQGERAAAMYKRSLANIPETEPTNVVPVVYYIGDSIAAGQVVISWVQTSYSGKITGPTQGTTTRAPIVRRYNRVAGVLQTSDPAVNSNRSGDISLFSGPDLSMDDAILTELFPQGFLLVKRGASSASLANVGIPYTDDVNGQRGGCWLQSGMQHFQELRTDVLAARNLAWEAGLIPDDRLVIVDLGTNDSGFNGGGAAFASALPQFCVDLRHLLKTRCSGPALTICWGRPFLGTFGRITAEMNTIRAAIAAQAAADSRFVFFNTDDLERNREDGIHDTPDSAVERGRRAIATAKPLVLAS